MPSIVCDVMWLTYAQHTSYVRDGRGCTTWDWRDRFTKNGENASHDPAPEQKLFRDRTEPTLFRAGTVPEMVPVWSLPPSVAKDLSVIWTQLSQMDNAYLSTQDSPVYWDLQAKLTFYHSWILNYCIVLLTHIVNQQKLSWNILTILIHMLIYRSSFL